MLRDKHQTADFSSWNEKGTPEEQIKKYSNKRSKSYKDLAFYLYLQFHADSQLTKIKKYGEEKGIVLKGDLPIGIYRYSSDAWMAPELYNMEAQAGAPPDDYAEDGQNWGFPTYNWEVMAKDQFLWWRKRMSKLAEYFGALRIDHILGFFRIWEIPMEQISGTLGRFNPRLPYSTDELSRHGLHGDYSRFTIPNFSFVTLQDLFGDDIHHIIKTVLNTFSDGRFTFRDDIEDQKTLKAFIESSDDRILKRHNDNLLRLMTEVLILVDEELPTFRFNPRITLHKTFLYQELSSAEKNIFDGIYNEYFFVRHDQFWKEQAYWKLPALLEATDMLICGEDLGMIPGSVPGVMKNLNVIPLEIQRMPKTWGEFGNPRQYDYFSVCSPSCHDMSTIRGWWEEDEDRATRFWNGHWYRHGNAPQPCPPEVVSGHIWEHLHSPSMIAIFPLQDLLGMDTSLRHPEATSQQINVPSNSNHYWRFRMHLNLEDILGHKEFIETLKGMIEDSGRL